ncbi:MAG: S24 family peptidase [Flavobacteriaceae bacterium]|nr:S24 family peptidase [Flavobacteriaceae bacterium]MDZ4147837.1 S24 family peptidase [Flavobacteriaceae bacterium]
MSKIINKRLILSNIKDVYKFKSDTDFANFLGIKPQTLSSWYSRNTFDIDLLYAKCVDINPDFLLSGNPPAEKRNVNKTLPNETVRKTVRFSDETKSIKNLTLSESHTGIPLIPVEAMAGFGIGSQQVMEYEAQRYVVPEFTELKVDFMVRVKGSSMYPKYNSGDIVACKKLNLQDVFFQWNKVYVLDTEQGALIKRIKKTNGNDTILIVSDNESYDSFELHLSKVNAIALVVGVIRLE